MTTIAMNQTGLRGADQTVLMYGGSSILLHCLLLALFSVMPHTTLEQESVPSVHVTLIDAQPSAQLQTQEEASPPPMKHTKRRSTSIPRPSMARPLTPTIPPPQLTTQAIMKPVPLQQKRSNPSARRVLNDTHATNILKMQSLVKVASSSTGPTTISRIKVGLKRTSKPRYPLLAREQGWEGTVKIRVVVLKDGKPGNVQVQQSSGYAALDQSAVEAVRTWHFIPARDGNMPVISVVEIPINFNLQQHG